MRKIILSVFAVTALFATSCKKEKQDNFKTPKIKNQQTSKVMSSIGSYNAGQLHNIMQNKLNEKYGNTPATLDTCIHRMIPIFDSIMGTHTDADYVANIMVNQAKDWGLLDNDEFLIKPVDGGLSLMASLEPNDELRTALQAIAINSVYNTSGTAEFATNTLKSLVLTDSETIAKRDMFLEIYEHSLEVNYPITLGWTAQGYADADSEGSILWMGYALANNLNMMYWSNWGSVTWSNNYNCHNM